MRSAGGRIASRITDICPDESVKKSFDVEFRYAQVAKLLGKDIPHEDLKKILAALEIEIAGETDQALRLKVPAYRVDVQREADVVEDVLRVYGYNHIEVSPMLHTSIVSDDKRSPERLWGIVADLLAANGYHEIMSNSLTKSAYAALSADIDPRRPSSCSTRSATTSTLCGQDLLFSALEAVQRNISFRATDLRLFELGKVYNRFGEKYAEENHIAMVVTGKASGESWREPQRDITYYDLRADFDRLMARLGVESLHTKPYAGDIFTEGAQIVSARPP